MNDSNMEQGYVRSSIDFINSQDFKYIQTYSLRRGEEYELFFKEKEKEFNRLMRKNYRTPAETDQFNDLNEQLFYTNNLFGKNGELDRFSKHTGTFSSDSQEAGRVKEILKTEIVEYVAWMCAPDYRDAIVFYDRDDKIISILNICLSCGHMEVKPFGQLEADLLTYDLLKQFFLEIGHEVEEPDHLFVRGKMKERREKILNERRDQSSGRTGGN